MSSEEIAEFLNRVRQPFNTNSLALAAGVEAIADKEHIAQSVEINKSGMEKIKKAFDALDFKYIESFGNFISFDSQMDSDSSFNFFLHKGIILRSLKVYEMPQHLRVSIGLKDEMDSFIKVLEEYKKVL